MQECFRCVFTGTERREWGACLMRDYDGLLPYMDLMGDDLDAPFRPLMFHSITFGQGVCMV